MSSNPFDRNKIREPKLGQIIIEEGPETRRDAVHIAVVPVIADEDMSPGDSVALTSDCKRAFRRDRFRRSWDNKTQQSKIELLEGAVGIVDPFIQEPVLRGDRFWLFLFPGQVTTLQHYWTHPAFPDEATVPVARTGKQESEAWLREYALRHWLHSTPEEGYRKLLEQMRTGALCYEGRDMHSRGELHDAEELRMHAENVLGIRINYDNFEYFSCSC